MCLVYQCTPTEREWIESVHGDITYLELPWRRRLGELVKAQRSRFNGHF